MHPLAGEALHGMDALMQRIVVYEADVPASAAASQRVAARSQPHVRLTLPAGAVPGTVERFVNMETAVPGAWAPGVRLMTTLRSGSRIQVVPPPGATPRSHTVGPLSPLSPSHGLFRGQTRLA